MHLNFQDFYSNNSWLFYDEEGDGDVSIREIGYWENGRFYKIAPDY